MALAAVKGVDSTGSLAVGILRLFSLDFPSASEIPPFLCTPYCLCTLDFPSASLCDSVISTVREGCEKINFVFYRFYWTQERWFIKQY
jgi:hypothetical protein